MKTLEQFLHDLRRLNVKLWVEDESLCYSAPEGVVSSDLLAELARRKPAILRFLAEARQAVQTQQTVIPKLSRRENLPLSFAQERLWFLDQLEPGNPFYNVFGAWRVIGTLRVDDLVLSLREIIRRHDTLRTIFGDVDGEPVQIVAETVPFDLPVIDLRQVPREHQAAETLRRARAEARMPFDLKTGPLFRATLLKTAENDHVLLLTMHHIISDGWSAGVLMHELSTLYCAFARGETPSLQPLAIQYADFAFWQRQWLQGDALDAQLAYWRKQLSGAPPLLELPVDKPRPPIQSYQGSSEQFTIYAELTEQLRALSRRAGTTMFMTVFAAFALLLSRYSDQSDVVIGSPIANRLKQELEPLIGFFVNTLALRIDLSGSPTFRELLARTRAMILDAFAHQDLPFEKLVNDLHPERDLSRNPLFQVMFALQNAPAKDITFDELRVEPFVIPRFSALFDLVLDAWEIDGTLTCVLEYNTDIFERTTILRCITHFTALLGEIVKQPDIPAELLSMLSESEQRQILELGAGPRADYPTNISLAQLFEAQTAAGPERIAAIYQNETVTYAELNQQANQIAALLRRLGVERNEFVGIFAERKIEFLTAILAILKAGGAYLPIDPDYPEERVQYMIANSRIPTLITHSELLERCAPLAQTSTLRNIVCLDSVQTDAWKFDDIAVYDRHAAAQESCENPPHVNDPRDRAYMLYTSGSTGLPKGAIIRHDGAINHIYGQFDALQFHRDSAFLQSAPSSADISVWQFLAPVLIGGRTVIINLDTVCDPAALFQVIKARKITLIELVPGVLKEFLEYAERQPPQERALPDLEWAMVTGEAASPALVNHWLRIYPNIMLVNAYGPTEAADDICQSVLTTPLPESVRNVSIGRPLANLTLYILDRRLRLQPLGVPGEICTAGIGVGEGYWQNEDKTRASFTPNPYATNAFDQVLYRTGDSGRWLPNGEIEFLGRLDQQVKIRGFRIELGEIEGVLAQHPLVRDAVVIDREDRPGDKRLVAYIVTNMLHNAAEYAFGALQTEQLSLWEELHDNSYSEAPPRDDPAFNTIGWDSTYTGLPLSDQEMREYVDYTVERVLAQRPQRVLEIGCGTGLLLYQIAPHCREYWGTDLSQTALQRIERSKQVVPAIQHVVLLHCNADRFDEIPSNTFDAAILCSVIQYFPGVHYLLRVLEGLLNTLTPGGSIFVGDVRSLALWQAYYASIQFYKTEPSVTRLELERRIRQQMLLEQELLIDPAFFLALPDHFPRVSAVEILPKRGAVHNELTRFRYDVMIHTDPKAGSVIPDEVIWEEWNAGQSDISSIRERLVRNDSTAWGLRRIRNRRLHAERQVLNWLRHAPETQEVGRLRERLAHNSPEGLDPEELWQLEREFPCRVSLRYSTDNENPGGFDALFLPQNAPTQVSASKNAHRAENSVPWEELANNPLQEKFTRKLTPQLRAFLRERVPEQMTPADFVVLGALPLLPNGKVNRKALPAPTSAGDDLAKGYVAPQTPTESLIAEIWAEVLGLEQVGVRSNFFELGGHSLKATQVISRIAQKLGVDIPVRSMFNKPTIEEFARDLPAQPVVAQTALERIPDGEHYPLSHAQRRLWILAQMEGASAAYHMFEALLLEGDVAFEAFQAAFTDLLERHEALRTTFFIVDAEPRQKVHSQIALPMRFYDLSAEPDPDMRAQALASEEAQAPFDLERGPLVRVVLLKLAEQRYALLFSMHHIISDGWSMTVLTREFLRLYHARMSGTPATLPPLRIQYRDYAHWQNQWLQTEAAAAHREYWLAKLARNLPTLNIPADFARPPVKTYHGRVKKFMLDAAQSRAIAAFCRIHQVSLFMTLAAAVTVLLYRYTGQEEIILGCPAAGRDHPELETQIGFYVNTVVLRNSLNGDLPFSAFLQQMKATTTEAYDHQTYPFDLLVDQLRLQRDVSRSPVFDVMVVLQNTEQADMDMQGVKISAFPIESGISQFDLTFGFEEHPAGLEVAIWYNTDLFKDSRIERLCGHLRTLFASILTDASRPLHRLNILPEEERKQLVETLNATSTAYPEHKTLVDLFEEQVDRTPEATAVIFEDRSLTYHQLNRQARQLAQTLRNTCDVKPDDLVAVILNRSDRVIAAFLGILNADGAYLPVDPDYPQERIRFILEDSACRVIVTEDALLPLVNECLPSERQTAVITVEALETSPALSCFKDIARAALPDHAAYIIYTSGSTGKPKGCVITHRNVVRLMKNDRFLFDFGPEDVWVVAHSFCFDFSVWEMYGALLYGGCVVVAKREDVRNTDDFRALLHKHRVSVLNQTPAAFYNLIEVEKQQDFHDLDQHLRYVIFGGDRLDPAYLKPWAAWYPLDKIRLINMYGITETTVHVTYGPLDAEDVASAEGRSPIGVPLPETSVWICDEHKNLQPIGIPGEMYVGGSGVSRGYLNRDDLTQARFLASPFRPDERLYKSGDLGCWREDGTLEHLGRNDFQVQLRGFRIELGEIEAVLLGHPAVRKCVVISRCDESAGAYKASAIRLIAYIVPDSSQLPPITALRQCIQAALPDYMAPSAFVFLDEIPLTSNGKVDRDALPEPDQQHSESEAAYISPRNEMEQILAQVWQEVLGREQIGVYDNFFDIGGNSLSIIQVNARLKERLGREIPVVELFQYASISALSQHLSNLNQPEESAVQQAALRAAKQKEARKQRQQRNR